MENIAVKIIYFFMKGCGWCEKFLPQWNLLKQNLDINDELKEIKHYEFESSELENNKIAKKIKKYVKIEGFPTIVLKINNIYYKYDGDRTFYNIFDFIRIKLKENTDLELEILSIIEKNLKDFKKASEELKQSGGNKRNYRKKYHKYKKLYLESLKK
jgi:hypothetical protein